MDGAAIKTLAQRWICEYGRDTQWHLRRKIAHLRDWGDDEGAGVYQRVLDHCEGRTPAAVKAAWFAPHSLRFLRAFRRAGLAARS